LDTHSWAWSLTRDARLSARAINAIEGAWTVFISPISFFEIAQKVRLGKWPEMGRHADRLLGMLETQGGSIAALNPAICVNAGLMTWEHRDPFDRLLAATASYYNLPIISADTIFDGVVTRIW
jgi:PIN domain nuclease of toxin-antitoxin system